MAQLRPMIDRGQEYAGIVPMSSSSFARWIALRNAAALVLATDPRVPTRVLFEARVALAALEPDFSTTDWAADCAEYPEHDADHHKDSADRVKNRKAGEVSNQEKDDAEHNHGQSDPVRRILEPAYE